MKIATWNVNSLRIRLQQVLDWLERNPVDILCLQELKMPDEEFPLAAFQEQGYYAEFYGQKAYNGVAIISTSPALNTIKGMEGFADEQKRYLVCDFACEDGSQIRVVNVYVPNGQALDSDKFVYKRRWFAQLRHVMQAQLQVQEKVILLGDFNIALSDIDVHDSKKWAGKIHCSPIERLMLHKLMACGLYDAYRAIEPEKRQFSWWDYRSKAYDRDEGLRIDLILANDTLMQGLQQCYIDETPRKLERPSDHTPVVAEFK